MVASLKFALVFVLTLITKETLDTEFDTQVERTLPYATYVILSLCPQLLNMVTKRSFEAIAYTFDVHKFYT
jgi:ABC-type uncharacterized transport system permease subunit